MDKNNNGLDWVRRQLIDILVPGFFPDRFYRVGKEVNKNKVDLKNKKNYVEMLSRQTVGREVKKNKVIFWAVLKYILKQDF